MEYTFTHGRQNCQKSAKRMTNTESQTTFPQHKQSLMSDTHQNQLAKKTNSTLYSQTVLEVKHKSEPIGKNAQVTLRAHKRSSTVDTPQNQLAKMTNSTSCSKEKFAGVHPGGLTRPWSSSARPDACFRSTKEKHTLPPNAKQGRNREDPRNTRFRQLLATSPKIPLLGPASLEQQAPHGHPGAPS